MSPRKSLHGAAGGGDSLESLTRRKPDVLAGGIQNGVRFLHLSTVAISLDYPSKLGGQKPAMGNVCFKRMCLALGVAVLVSCSSRSSRLSQEPRTFGAATLQSWSGAATKASILDFVATVTDRRNRHYVSPEQRIAVFDLDGTLLVERPNYVEVLVAMARLREQALLDPLLGDKEPYHSVVIGDESYIRSEGKRIVATAASDEALKDFQARVRSFLARNRHPTLHRPYSALFYKPMLELIQLLQENDFRTYVVTQSQQEYVRAFSAPCIGIDSTGVIGSMYAFRQDDSTETPSFVRTSTIWRPYNVDGGKVLRIRERTGGTPILAFGNSSGDLEVLRLVATAEKSLVLILDHDDEEREFEYSHRDLLATAHAKGWQVVSMEQDFRTLFAEPCLTMK